MNAWNRNELVATLRTRKQQAAAALRIALVALIVAGLALVIAVVALIH